MIVPTIGRVVLVHRPGSSPQREPAFITFVWNDRMINVGGFDFQGKPFSATSLPLVQDSEPYPDGMFAEWMPYQKQVASGAIAPTLHAEPKA